MSLYYPELGDVSSTTPVLESVDSEAEQLQVVSEGCCIFSSEPAVSVPVCSAPLQVEGKGGGTPNRNNATLYLCQDFKLFHSCCAGMNL